MRPAAAGPLPPARLRAGGVGPAVAGRRRRLACGGDGPAAASRRRRAWPVGGGPTEAGPATEARADQSQVRRQRCGGRPAEAGLRPLPARLRRPAGPPAYLRAGGVGPGPGLAASGRAGGGGSLHFCATRRRCAGSPLACMQRSAVHAARAGGEAVADAELCGTAEPASHARLHAALRCGTPAQSCLNADLLVQHGSRPADISPARAGAATASNPLTGSYVVTCRTGPERHFPGPNGL